MAKNDWWAKAEKSKKGINTEVCLEALKRTNIAFQGNIPKEYIKVLEYKIKNSKGIVSKGVKEQIFQELKVITNSGKPNQKRLSLDPQAEKLIEIPVEYALLFKKARTELTKEESKLLKEITKKKQKEKIEIAKLRKQMEKGNTIFDKFMKIKETKINQSNLDNFKKLRKRK